MRSLVGGGTTQYLEEADQLADRISVVDRGRVIADGTADEQQLVGAGAGPPGAEVVEPAEHLQVLPAAEPLVERGVLAEQPDPGPYPVGPRHRVVPGDRRAARVRPRQGGQYADRRRLARAVRAEEGVHGAASYPQIRSGQREPVPVGLPYALDVDRVGHAHPALVNLDYCCQSQ
ncbi:hypothetical protein Shyhy01_04220 [Streptomyces hygroscopicus subsp. hygroscopicus]|nr:hypothetical protein Shyhy01_04220 [Streptomyces hygroscopicus subsp. hygroscopicus]